MLKRLFLQFESEPDRRVPETYRVSGAPNLSERSKLLWRFIHYRPPCIT